MLTGIRNIFYSLESFLYPEWEDPILARVQDVALPILKDKKAFEAEDLYEDTLPIAEMRRRSNSFSDVSADACFSKSSKTMDCIGRRRSDFGRGFVYLFTSKKEFDDWSPGPHQAERRVVAEKIRKEIFPAVEPSTRLMAAMALGYDVEKYVRHCKRQNRIDGIDHNEAQIRADFALVQEEAKLLDPFGYRVFEDRGQIILELPDRDAIHAAYRAFQKAHPEKNLKDFSVGSGERITNDENFSTANISHHAILSERDLFVHDSIYHVQTQLMCLLEDPDLYEIDRLMWNESVWSIYRNIYRSEEIEEVKEHLDKLYFLPGMITDVIASKRKRKEIKGFNEQAIYSLAQGIWQNQFWTPCIQKRFQTSDNETQVMDGVWDIVNKNAESFNRKIRDKRIQKVQSDIRALDYVVRPLARRYPESLLLLKKVGISGCDVAKLDTNTQLLVMQNPYPLIELAKAGISTSLIGKLSLDAQKICLSKPENVIQLREEGVSFEALIKFSYNDQIWALEHPDSFIYSLSYANHKRSLLS